MSEYGSDSHAGDHHGGDVGAAIDCNDHSGHHGVSGGFSPESSEHTYSWRRPRWQVWLAAGFIVLFVWVAGLFIPHKPPLASYESLPVDAAVDGEPVSSDHVPILEQAQATCQWSAPESGAGWYDCGEAMVASHNITIWYVLRGVHEDDWKRLQSEIHCHAKFANHYGARPFYADTHEASVGTDQAVAFELGSPVYGGYLYPLPTWMELKIYCDSHDNRPLVKSYWFELK